MKTILVTVAVFVTASIVVINAEANNTKNNTAKPNTVANKNKKVQQVVVKGTKRSDAQGGWHPRPHAYYCQVPSSDFCYNSDDVLSFDVGSDGNYYVTLNDHSVDSVFVQ